MKKNIAKVLFLLALCFSVLIFVSCNKEESNDTRLAVENGLPVVDRYGQLQVIGTNLCNQDGQPVQLRGMSSHGLHWYGKFANKDVLQWLRDDWNTQVWRAAMYLAQGGYVTSRACKLRMIDSIEAALELGMYVIVDWHVHGDRDPLLYKDQAIEFFTEIAQKYGDNPHIIYEICNEPNGDDVTWKDNIKPYAEEVIATIRQYDPDNIIIVGTSTWSQDVDVAAKDPIDAENIMYTMHFYAGTHGRELKAKAKRALRKGLPI
ncbi:MAG: glycoside hydrolase family 5 protein, partial [Spirochaetaceae bacterium]|nr:glycoside hydrolase family 5 protein [Spirochaetaceae bacterium]